MMARLREKPPDGTRPIHAHLVLVEPLIGGNTGSLARVCAGTHAMLHLIEPLGYTLDDRHLRRAGLDWPDPPGEIDTLDLSQRLYPGAPSHRLSDLAERLGVGLDYWPDALWSTHPSLEACLEGVPRERIFFFSAEGGTRYDQVRYPAEPWLVFGKETTGLAPELRVAWADRLLRLPISKHIRSLNLANVATAALYEALRQRDFPDLP